VSTEDKDIKDETMREIEEGDEDQDEFANLECTDEEAE